MKMCGTNIIEILLVWLPNAWILRSGLIMLKYHNEELKYIYIYIYIYIYEYDHGLMVDWKKFESGYNNDNVKENLMCIWKFLSLV